MSKGFQRFSFLGDMLEKCLSIFIEKLKLVWREKWTEIFGILIQYFYRKLKSSWRENNINVLYSIKQLIIYIYIILLFSRIFFEKYNTVPLFAGGNMLKNIIMWDLVMVLRVFCGKIVRVRMPFSTSLGVVCTDCRSSIGFIVYSLTSCFWALP